MLELAFFGGVADRLQLESMRVEPVGRKTVRSVLGELARFVQDDGAACTSPLVCFPNDRAGGDEECDVMKAGLAAGVGARLVGLVEEQLCASITVGPVVERSSRARLEPLAEPEDRHEVVVVLLGRGEIRNADPDVVDKSGSRQHGTSRVVNGTRSYAARRPNRGTGSSYGPVFGNDPRAPRATDGLRRTVAARDGKNCQRKKLGLLFQRGKVNAEIARVYALQSEGNVVSLIHLLDSDLRGATRYSIVRSHAVTALGKLGDPRVIPYLIEKRHDPEDIVRMDVMRALSRLGTKQPGMRYVRV